jgi:hypothetical protein
MTTLQDIIEILKKITTLITGILALIVSILALFGKLTEVWNTIRKPLLKLLIFSGTVVAPNGIILWFFMDLAAQNHSRLGERLVFLSLVAQPTLFISLYAFCWGKWLYPWLRPLFGKQDRVAKQLPSDSHENSKQKPLDQSENKEHQ